MKNTDTRLCEKCGETMKQNKDFAPLTVWECVNGHITIGVELTPRFSSIPRMPMIQARIENITFDESESSFDNND